MASFINHLEKRIRATQDDLEEAQVTLVKAQNRVERLGSELGGYSKVLEAEQRRSGATQETTASEVQRDASDEPSASLNGSDVNKSAFIRDFIANHPGARPVEIHRALKEKNILVVRAYVYSVLNRAKTRKSVRVRKGKYYPVIQEEKDEPMQ